MQSEFLQLIAALGFFLIVFAAWLFMIYVPGRTMENWKGPEVESKNEPKPPPVP